MKKTMVLLAVAVFTLTLGIAAFAAEEPVLNNGITVFSTMPVAPDDGAIGLATGPKGMQESEYSGEAAGGLREDKLPSNGITYFGSAPAAPERTVPESGDNAEPYNGITVFSR